MINLFVAGQKLTVAQPLVAADTIDYLEVCVHPQTGSWRGRSIWAHFQQGEKNYQLMLTDLQIRKDAGLNLGTGEWKVWLHGTAEDGSRITTDVQTLTVQPTGPMEGGPLPEISPTVAEQIDAKSQQALNAAQQAVAEAAKVQPYAESAQANATAAAHSAEVAGQLEASAADSASLATSAATAAAKSAEQASSHATAAQADAGVAAEQAGKAETANTAAQEAKAAAAQSAKAAADSAAQCAHSAEDARRAEEAAGVAEGHAQAAKDSQDAAAGSAKSASTDAGTASQALADLLAMLGTDIATLVGGKIPVEQIPSIATTEIYTAASQQEQEAITAENGDILIRTDENKSYIWKDTGWVYLASPTDFAAKAGYAETAGTAENANKINGHRMVEMTREAFETAVKDPETFYLIYDPASEV